MNARAFLAYANTEIETGVAVASSRELLIYTYERIIDCLRRARSQLESGEDCAEVIDRALLLIEKGLRACLDFDAGGEIAKNLSIIYDWASRELLRARIRQQPELIADVERVLVPLVDAWRLIGDRTP